MRLCHGVDLMLGQRLRRWPNIKSTPSQSLTFTGEDSGSKLVYWNFGFVFFVWARSVKKCIPLPTPPPPPLHNELSFHIDRLYHAWFTASKSSLHPKKYKALPLYDLLTTSWSTGTTIYFAASMEIPAEILRDTYQIVFQFKTKIVHVQLHFVSNYIRLSIKQHL